MGKMKDLELLFQYAEELEDRLSRAIAEIEDKGVYEEYIGKGTDKKKKEDALDKLYQKISKAEYEMELSWHKFIEKASYYKGLVESIRTSGFDEHYIAWQKNIEKDLPF